MTAELERVLEHALRLAEHLESEFGTEADNIGPRIGAYLVGTLSQYISSTDQPGAIPDIYKAICYRRNEIE